MKTKGRRQSKNVQDLRGGSPGKEVGGPLMNNNKTRAGSITAFKTAVENFGALKVSEKNRKNAKGLGMSSQLEALQNQANKAQAKRRTRDRSMRDMWG